MKEQDYFIPAYAHIISGLNDNAGSYRVQRPLGAADYLIIFTLAGSGIFRNHQQETLLSADTLAIIPPHTPQDYATAAGCRSWQILWFHVQPWSHWTRLLKHPLTAAGISLLRLKEDALATLRASLDQAHRAASGGNPYRALLAMNALERALLACAQSSDLGQLAPRDGRIAAVCEYMGAHLARTLTIAHLAKQSGLSLSRFSHLFCEQMGCAPLAYFDGLRMDRARDLLACTALPIAEIATEVGYGDPFYFSRRFKQKYGASPRDYRAREWLAAGPPA